MICKSCKKPNVNSLMFIWDGNREWYCWNCGAPNDSTLIENIDQTTMKRWTIAEEIMTDWAFSPPSFASDILNNIRSAIAGAYLLGQEDKDKKQVTQVTNSIPIQTFVTIELKKMLDDIRHFHYTKLEPIFQKVIHGQSTEGDKSGMDSTLNLLHSLGKKARNRDEELSRSKRIGDHWRDFISRSYFTANPFVNQVYMDVSYNGKSYMLWVCDNPF